MPRSRLLLAATFLAAAISHANAAGFAGRPDVRAFASDLASRHGFDEEQLLAALAAASYEERAIKLIRPPNRPGVRSWRRYQERFVEPVRVRAGLQFWQDHEEALGRAENRFGVPAEIILGIIGVETIFGRNTGAFPLIGALATLAFDYPPRAALFRRELEQLFLMARENGRSPDSYFGSYAGAIGVPQFLPSSVRHYAIDFDGDARVDLENSASDAIGSVAHYLSEHGWRADGAIADPVVIGADRDVSAFVAAGIEPTLDANALRALDIVLRGDVSAATLVDLETPDEDTEYWLGYHNFYVITRYNRSSFYAMAVFQLAQALREARVSASASVVSR